MQVSYDLMDFFQLILPTLENTALMFPATSDQDQHGLFSVLLAVLLNVGKNVLQQGSLCKLPQTAPLSPNSRVCSTGALNNDTGSPGFSLYLSCSVCISFS